MACGCGKNKVARPTGATLTSRVQTQQTQGARVVSAVSPYSAQQMPPHLQQRTVRKTV